MFARLTVAAAAAAAVLTVDARMESGEWKGVPWSYRMNEIPVGCKQAGVGCSVTSMWHKYGQSEYYSAGEGDVDITLAGAEGRKNFTEAQEFCAELQASLIQIDNRNEMEFAITLLKNNRHGFWLGLAERDDDLFPEFPLKLGFAKWEDGSAVNFENWAEGEPNSERHGPNNPDVDQWIDRCAFQGTNKGDPTLWNDAHCGKRRRFICERKLESYPNDVCDFEADPTECEGYYQLRCLDINGSPAIGFDVCPVKCNSCQTTTTSVATTTTSVATTTTSVATTTSTVQTTTTTVATTTTTVQTTTTTFATTTTTFGTTTTTGSTTTFGTTTTTAEPSTITTTTETPPELGPCMQQPLRRGWYSPNDPFAANVTQNDSFVDYFEPSTVGGERMHCCYKFFSKPRLSWNDAQATCEAIGAADAVSGYSAGLANAYTQEINTFISQAILQRPEFDHCGNSDEDCRGKSNGDTTWLGGTTKNGTRVEWTNPYFAAWSGNDYGNTTGNHFATWHQNDTGMFYEGEPSEDTFRKPTNEDCLSQGGAHARVNEFGAAGWNDAKCKNKKSYMCEFCVRESTTTTGPATTTSTFATTTTSVATTTTSVATTTTSVATTTTTVQTSSTTFTTSTTEAPSTSTVEPDCGSITCAADCGVVWKRGDPPYDEYCGWSQKQGGCYHQPDPTRRPARTTYAERNMGDCGITQTTEKPMSVEEKCGTSYCSRTCGFDQAPSSTMANGCAKFVGGVCVESECGWSKKYRRCIEGGRTSAAEVVANLGPKCIPDSNVTQQTGP